MKKIISSFCIVFFFFLIFTQCECWHSPVFVAVKFVSVFFFHSVLTVMCTVSNVPSDLAAFTQNNNYTMHTILCVHVKKNKIVTLIFWFLDIMLCYRCDEEKYDGGAHYCFVIPFLLRNAFQISWFVFYGEASVHVVADW